MYRPRFYDKSYFPENNGDFPQPTNNSLLNRAVHEGCLITQAPAPMVYMVALVTASTAQQGVLDVELPIKKVCPAAVMGLTIAPSGERKSTVDNLYTKGVKAFEKNKNESYKKEEGKYLLKLELHKDRAALIKRSFDFNDEGQFELAYERLLAHKENEPIKPAKLKLIYENTTMEALLVGMKEDSPNVFFGSSEGGNALFGRALQQSSIFCAIWSGDDVNIDRRTVKSFTLSGARLTFHIMTQPSALDRYIKKTKDDVRGNGFLSRLLICAPYSNCGSRPISEVRHSTENLDEYNNKITKLLSDTFELDNHADRRVIVFSDKAKKIWIDVANDIEIKMQPNGLYYNAKDHASKLAENIARVAALIHCFEYPLDKEISTNSLWEAINLVSYFSGQFMSVFCAPPKHVADAQNLTLWLGKYADSGIRYIKRNNILQYGPSGTRKKTDLEAALGYMRPSNKLAEIISRKTRVIDLWPQQQFDEVKLNQDLLQDIVF
jgi:hypothetical protein